MSSRSKYKTSTINYLLVFFSLHFDLKLKNKNKQKTNNNVQLRLSIKNGPMIYFPLIMKFYKFIFHLSFFEDVSLVEFMYLVLKVFLKYTKNTSFVLKLTLNWSMQLKTLAHL